MKKTIIVFLAIALILCYLSGCAKLPQKVENWNSFSPVPFGGYICGFEKQKVLIQLPFFYLSEDSIDIGDISKVVLCGDNTVLDCDEVNFLQPKHNKDHGYSLSTLTFRAVMPSSGSYVINRILITLRDNRTIEKALGDIVFEIVEGTLWNDSLIFASNFLINQVDNSTMKVTYTNNTSEVVKITDVSFLDSMYSGVSVKKYIDLEPFSPANR